MNDDRYFPKGLLPSCNFLRLCSQVAASQTVQLPKSDPVATLSPPLQPQKA